jgi:O-methyltransferase involved in polyketide biosynthesis
MMKGLADTLFIPLNARIVISKKFPEYFYDKKALALEKQAPKNKIQKKSSEYNSMASVARAYNVDDVVKSFIERNGKCNVVYLGAGLETAYYRLKNQEAMFYEVDLPEVIIERRRLLGEEKNEVLISGDLFDLKWVEKLDVILPTILVSSGVFMYFKEDKIIKFICDVQAKFETLELIFDATNDVGIKYANKYVKKTGNKEAEMYFYVNDAREFMTKCEHVVLIEEIPFYIAARKILKRKLKLSTRICMKITDDKKRVKILHLKLC